ncbi:carbonic anhydrase [Streptacidiphilus cavernicola]|uniref:carbonic anhydrase n=1 Tax=Streptacidiphilus cavernicola TaxID=3342716 RepID=A0ABV6W3Y5_9ACTN
MPEPTALTPAQALDLLRQGNRRFVDGLAEHPNQDASRRAQLAPVQHPFAVLFGCSDSRLAAEIIFDRGLGDLFVVRTAGHVAGPEVLGSIEYGVSILGCPLVVVLGHDTCGAVGAALSAVDHGTEQPGYVGDVVERVTPSVLAGRAAGLTEPDDFVDLHIRRTVDQLLNRSRVLAEAQADGRLAVVGLSYRLVDGSARVVVGPGGHAEP